MADLDSVRTVLAQAIASHDYATPAVRESVIAYARHERKRAVPPERLVIAVKTWPTIATPRDSAIGGAQS